MHLENYNFNSRQGFLAVILFSIAVSLCFFSIAYMIEGIGWLGDDEELSLDIGWNWIRGSGVAFLIAVLFFIISSSFGKKSSSQKAGPWKGRLDWNEKHALLGIVFLSVAFTFFLNSGIYWIETEKWFYGGIYSATSWYFDEAAAWANSATWMSMIGIVLAAAGWFLIARSWKRKCKN